MFLGVYPNLESALTMKVDMQNPIGYLIEL